MSRAGVMIGHACTDCGKTVAECDVVIRESGTGCCPSCFTRDTHGLLDKFKVIEVADQQQQIQNLTRLAAQTVIGFSEHAKAIRKLRAEMTGLIQENAYLRGRVQELERREEMVDARDKARVIKEVMDEVRLYVRNLPERVTEVEDCVVGLENHLKLWRKPKAYRPKALPPGR